MLVRGPEYNLAAAARALLRLNEIEWVYFSVLSTEPPCGDIPPTTDDYFGDRDLLPEILDYHASDPGLNISYAWDEYSARGQGIQIADVEGGYISDHEDLCNINIEPGQVPGQTFPECHHGTAVMGMLGALDNGYGWTGLVPDATLWFFPVVNDPTDCIVQTVEIWRPERALAAAIATIEPGDVVLLEIQTGRITNPDQFPGLPAEIEPSIWHLTKCATDSDILVVGAAGNGNWNLDCPTCPECPGGLFCTDFSDYQNRGDSHAILVGGGTSDDTHERCGVFGTLPGCIGPTVGTTYGQRVNVQGWFANVFSLGYGDYDDGGGDVRQSYTKAFNGTSSASPMAAGCVVAIQSFVDSQYNCRLKPLQMRNLLIDTGIPQGPLTADEHIGPLPNVGAALDLLNQLGSQDCNSNLIPDACEYGDCNDNGTQGICEIANCPPENQACQDCNSNSIPDECEPNEDCQTNGTRDICDIGAGTSQDCNGNDVPDECDLTSGFSQDCNSNNIPDECDLWLETSQDCNFNVIPDECEADCQPNGVADECDISSGASQDCNDNGVPDDCEPDCQPNGVADECDISTGTSQDCTGNGIPDECEPDCQPNGVADSCDIDSGTSDDCNSNGIPDDCESACDPIGDCSANPDCCCVTNPFKPRCRPWDNVCVLCYDDSHCGSGCCCKPNGSCFCGPFACGEFGPQGP